MRNILKVPAIYRLFKNLIGPDASISMYVQKHVRPLEGDKVLDIGCGPGDILQFLPDISYMGFDMNREYIEAAKKRYGHRGTFLCKEVSEKSIFEPASFDIVLANGIIHHLDDIEATHLLNLASFSLKPTGRLVTFDGCYTDNQSKVARYILLKDRGKFVRNEEGYLDLARGVFPSVKASIYNDLLRIPYTHIIMECQLNK